MNVSEAKTQIIEMVRAELGKDEFSETLNPDSPDTRDPGKFSFLGQPARVIHRFNGWNTPINLNWFSGKLDLPKIKGGEFYWYAFAIPKYSGFSNKHYFICDYLQMRDWVMEFKSPLGTDYRDQGYWRADIQPYGKSKHYKNGYFRWGDESAKIQDQLSRIIMLDNIKQIVLSQDPEQPTRRITTEVSRIVRDTRITKQLKGLYGNKCQVCGLSIGLPDQGYSEAHHIKPLGNPHNGPDEINNLVILCPNHHAEFDRGLIAIHPDTLEIIHIDSKNQYFGLTLHLGNGHKLAREFLLYHHDKIFNKQTE